MANNRFSKLNLIFVTVAILAASFSFELVFNMLGSIGINMARYEHYIYDSEGGGKFIRLILFGGIWILYYLNKEKHLQSRPSAEGREKDQRRTFPLRYQIQEAAGKGEASPAGVQPLTEILLSTERPVAG